MRNFWIGFAVALGLCLMGAVGAGIYVRGRLHEAIEFGERATAAQQRIADDYRSLIREYNLVIERDRENIQRIEQLEGDLSRVTIQAGVLRDTVRRSGNLTTASKRVLDELDSLLRSAIIEAPERETAVAAYLGGNIPGRVHPSGVFIR